MRLNCSDRALANVRIIKRLGQSGNSHQQAMSPGKDGYEQLLDDLLLPDDDLAEFVGDLPVGHGQGLDRLPIFCRKRHGWEIFRNG